MPTDVEQHLNEGIAGADAEEGGRLEWELWGRPTDLSELLARIASGRDSL